MNPIRLDGLLAKVESTYGTDAVPVAATDGIRLSERVWNNLRLGNAWPNLRDEVASGGLVPVKPGVPTGRHVTLEIAWEAKGAGSAYSSSVKPEAAPLFVACGLSETIDTTPSSEMITYAQADTGHGSCTIYAYGGGQLFKIVGCRGTFRWPIQAGQLGLIRFTMQGMLLTDPTDVSLPAITYNAQIPQAAVGMSLAVGGWSPDVESAEFIQGAEVQQLDDANATDGIDAFAISQVLPSYTLAARRVALSTYNPYAVKKARTAGDIDQTLGSVQYNQLKLDVNASAYLEDIGHVDQKEFAAWDLEYILRGSSPFALIFD